MKPLKLLPSAMILASAAVLLWVMTQGVLLPRQEKAFGGRTWIV